MKHISIYLILCLFLISSCVPSTAPETNVGSVTAVEDIAISAGPDQTVSMNKDNLALQAEVKHPRPDQLKYSWTLVSGGGNLAWEKTSSKSYVRNFTPGVYTFRLSVKDSSKSYSDEVTVTVLSPSQTPPSVTAGSDTAITLPNSQVNLMGDATDPDGGVLNYNWSKISGNSANLVTPNSNRTRVSGLTAGEYTFKLTVTDPQGNSASDEVKVIVNSPANRNPLITSIPNQQIKLPISSLTLTGIATDPDGDELTYLWSKGAGGVATIETSTKSSTKVSGLEVGNYTFMLKVTDSKGAFGWVSAKLEVLPADNIAPVAKAGEDQSIVLPTNTVRLAGIGTDANGDTLQYAWIKVAGSNATIVSPSSATTAVNDLVKGSYTFRLTVTDSKGGSSTDDVVITVAAANNVAPIANAGSDKQVYLPANSIVLKGTGTDPYEDNLTYSWSKISGGEASIESPTYATTNVTNLAVGAYTFRLTVKDSSNATGTDDVLVTVLPAIATENALSSPNLTIIKNSNIYVHLRWKPVDSDVGHVDLYEIERDTDPNFTNPVLVFKSAGIEHFDSFPNNKQTYFYRLRAIAPAKRIINKFEPNKGTSKVDSHWSSLSVTPLDEDSVLTSAKPDMIRGKFSISNGVVTGPRPFTDSDIGKIISIKGARRFVEYRQAPIWYNGFILSVGADGNATIGPRFVVPNKSNTTKTSLRMGDPLNELVNVVDSDGYFGTNNFDRIQADIEALISSNKNTLIFPKGSYLLDIVLSNHFSQWVYNDSPYTLATNGLYIKDTRNYANANILIRGATGNRDEIVLKFGGEDREGFIDEVPNRNDVNSSYNPRRNFRYHTVGISHALGDLGLKDLTAEGPDELVRISGGQVKNFYQYSRQNLGVIKVFHENFRLKGGVNSDWRAGFQAGWSASRDEKGDGKYVLSFSNSVIENSEPITMFYGGRLPNQPSGEQFVSDTYGSRLIHRNTKIVGSGRSMAKVVRGKVSVVGDNYVISVSDPNFSFFDFNDSYPLSPNIRIKVGNTVYMATPGANWSQFTSLITSNQIQMPRTWIHPNAPNTGEYDLLINDKSYPDLFYQGHSHYVISSVEFDTIGINAGQVYQNFIRRNNPDRWIGSHKVFTFMNYTELPITPSNYRDQYIINWIQGISREFARNQSTELFFERGPIPTVFEKNHFPIQTNFQTFDLNSRGYVYKAYISASEQNMTPLFIEKSRADIKGVGVPSCGHVVKDSTFTYVNSSGDDLYVDNSGMTKSIGDAVYLRLAHQNNRVFMRDVLTQITYASKSNSSKEAGAASLVLDDSEIGGFGYVSQGGQPVYNWFVDGTFQAKFTNVKFVSSKTLFHYLDPIFWEMSPGLSAEQNKAFAARHEFINVTGDEAALTKFESGYQGKIHDAFYQKLSNKRK